MPRAKSPQKQADALKRASYKALLEIVKNGRPVIDKETGRPMLDENGKPVTTPPTAADLQQARMMQKELYNEAKTGDYSDNPYAQATRRRTRRALREDDVTD